MDAHGRRFDLMALGSGPVAAACGIRWPWGVVTWPVRAAISDLGGTIHVDSRSQGLSRPCPYSRLPSLPRSRGPSVPVHKVARPFCL